jgi:hypothetical protein
MFNPIRRVNSMSNLVSQYILALLLYQKVSSISQMSRFLGNISHDRLTDLLDDNWDGQTLLNSFVIQVIDQVGGYLVFDDTVIPKPYSSNLDIFSYIYDHSKGKTVYGIGLVLLSWTNGFIKIPIAYSIYKKGGTKRPRLALDLLSFARNKLKLKRIQGVFFDSWYSSEKILKRIRDYGWHFYTQVKSNRHFNGIDVKHYRYGAFWHEVGVLNGGIKVLLIKHYQKYYITSDLTSNWRESYNLYRIIRQNVEEIFKILKDQLCLCFLKDKKEHHWNHHIALELSAFIVLEMFSKNYNLTPYRMKEELICRREEFIEDLSDWIARCA